MSVLIDGIPMPKDCRDCCFKYKSDASDRLVYCYISGCWIIPKDSERAEVCLLKETQPKPQWIPCSERLPEEPRNYLVSIKRVSWNYKEYVENDIAYWDDIFHKADKVIAWMPLPEPYQREGEQDENYRC